GGALHRRGGAERRTWTRGADPEGPPRAARRPHEVVAGPLDRRPTQTHELARARHQLEPEDVVGRDPVLEAVGAPSVGGHVSPDRRDHLARGVGREKISVTCYRSGENEVDETRLDRRTRVR